MLTPFWHSPILFQLSIANAKMILRVGNYVHFSYYSSIQRSSSQIQTPGDIAQRAASGRKDGGRVPAQGNVL